MVTRGIRKAESLREELPSVKETFLRLARQTADDGPGQQEGWRILTDFLAKCDRPEAEQTLVSDLAEIDRQGEPLDESDLRELLDVLESISKDLESYLRDRVWAETELTDEWVELEKQFDDAAREGLIQDRERRETFVRDFIYRTPGSNIAQLRKKLERDEDLDIIYTTLWNTIEALEDEGEIVTIGGGKGTSRNCFPPPDKVNRSDYWGHSYPVDGHVDQEITSSLHFPPGIPLHPQAHIVNHAMDPAILVTPVGWNLPEGSQVTGFGLLESLDRLDNSIEVTSETNLTTRDVIVAQKLSFDSEGRSFEETDREFLKAFEVSESPN